MTIVLENKIKIEDKNGSNKITKMIKAKIKKPSANKTIKEFITVLENTDDSLTTEDANTEALWFKWKIYVEDRYFFKSLSDKSFCKLSKNFDTLHATKSKYKNFMANIAKINPNIMKVTSELDKVWKKNKAS